MCQNGDDLERTPKLGNNFLNSFPIKKKDKTKILFDKVDKSTFKNLIKIL